MKKISVDEPFIPSHSFRLAICNGWISICHLSDFHTAENSPASQQAPPECKKKEKRRNYVYVSIWIRIYIYISGVKTLYVENFSFSPIFHVAFFVPFPSVGVRIHIFEKENAKEYGGFIFYMFNERNSYIYTYISHVYIYIYVVYIIVYITANAICIPNIFFSTLHTSHGERFFL